MQLNIPGGSLMYPGDRYQKWFGKIILISLACYQKKKPTKKNNPTTVKHYDNTVIITRLNRYRKWVLITFYHFLTLDNHFLVCWKFPVLSCYFGSEALMAHASSLLLQNTFATLKVYDDLWINRTRLTEADSNRHCVLDWDLLCTEFIILLHRFAAAAAKVGGIWTSLLTPAMTRGQHGLLSISINKHKYILFGFDARHKMCHSVHYECHCNYKSFV